MSSPAVPVYDEAYYRDYDGQRYERSDQWTALFGHFAERIVTTLAPDSTLDAGCAIGLLVEALLDRGVDAHGIDISEYAIGTVPDALRDRCHVQTLTEPIEGRYDLVTCIEVIEHLPASEAPDAIANLCAVTDTVLLSSTPTEHEEPSHLNVQPPEYWSALFAAHGFLRDTDYDASFVSPWAVLYRRRTSLVGEVVRSYDRAWWRLRDENQRMRTALIDLSDERELLSALVSDDEWDAVRAATDPSTALKATIDRLREQRADGWGAADAEALEAQLLEARNQLVDAQHELLVMRDELLGAQARAGEMASRLAQVEGQFGAEAPLRQRYAELEAQHSSVVNSITWRLTGKLLSPYRRLRARS